MYYRWEALLLLPAEGWHGSLHKKLDMSDIQGKPVPIHTAHFLGNITLLQDSINVLRSEEHNACQSVLCTLKRQVI